MLGGATGVRDTLNSGVSIGRVDFTIALATDGTSVDLTSAFDFDTIADPDELSLRSAGANRLQIAFNDSDTTVSDMAWTKTFIGKNNSDDMLDPGEKAVISVWLHCQTGVGAWTNNLAGSEANFIGGDIVDTYHTFTIEVKPVTGATLTIQRTTPAYLDPVVDMH
jgi:archaellin